MLVSIWWVVAALILGGSGGVLVLAMFSGRPDADTFDDLRFEIQNRTQTPTMT